MHGAKFQTNLKRQKEAELLKEEEEKKKQKAVEKTERVTNYSKYVKEMYWPPVSERKREEIS